jgi:tRNA A-37 threonylcarbamoyl transferase component Bud32
VDEQSFVVPPDLRVGSTVANRYRVVRLLGEGGMGAVYEGEHIRIKRRVAIKFLHLEYARSPAALTRFRREALAATATGNPHVVEVLDLDQAEDGTPFMVLEFLEGVSLFDEVERRGPLALPRALAIMEQLCAALDVVHAKGITHRDIKPENLFLITRDGRPDFVKILDFGISKFATSHDGESGKLTKTGTAVGSIYFMSPEQTRGRDDVDARSDIYALGGVLFYLLTGRPVFEGDSIPYIMMQIVTDPPPALAIFRPELPAHVGEVITRALAKDREQRFQDCTSLFLALDRASPAPALGSLAKTVEADSSPDGWGESAAAHSQAGTFDPLPRPPWRRVVLPIATVLALAAGGAWWMQRRPADPAPASLAAERAVPERALTPAPTEKAAAVPSRVEAEPHAELAPAPAPAPPPAPTAVAPKRRLKMTQAVEPAAPVESAAQPGVEAAPQVPAVSESLPKPSEAEVTSDKRELKRLRL